MNDKVKNPAAVELGRLGGRVKSAKKAEAVRRNGKRGGWHGNFKTVEKSRPVREHASTIV